VIDGSKRDAILCAVGANADHGQRRTNADKRRAVQTMLQDPEWSGWSDRQIADQCAVSHNFVGSLRSANVTVNGLQSPINMRTTKDGREISTKSIGKTKFNGHDAPDPPDVAEARAAGRIPAENVVTVDEPEDTTMI
jgi:hypothetical protein